MPRWLEAKNSGARTGKRLAKFQGGELPDWPKYDTNFKMNPPLRSARDREAILEGLADGTIEILCSDHAPHCDYEKEVEFDYAPFGITGLETELALSLMQLVHAKRLSLADLIAKFTVNPARLLNLNKGTLSVGADADVTVFDPDCEWVFRTEDSASKSKNSPFFGWKLKGRAVATIVGGKIVWSEKSELVAALKEFPSCLTRLVARLASRGILNLMKAILALEDGSVFHGEGFGAQRVGLRRGLLQHLDDRLPGNPHRPVLQRPDRHDDLSAHRQLRRQRRGRGIVAAARRRLRHPRTFAGRQQLARGFFARGISGEKRHPRHSGH